MKKSSQLSILTFNTKGTPLMSRSTYERIDKIGIYLNKVDVNLINLQEVFTYAHLRLLKKQMISFPYLSFNKYIFGPKGGLVTFSKLPIHQYDYFPFPQSRSLVKRVILSKGILISKIEGSDVLVANTHLNANRDNDWSTSNRFYSIHKAQILSLSKFINRFKRHMILIVSGDFNIAKSSMLYKSLVRAIAAQDVFEEYISPTFHQEFMSEGEYSNRIDYIFAKTGKGIQIDIKSRKELFDQKVFQNKLNKGYLSDHIGLAATIKLQ